MTEPPPPELANLFAAERAAPVASPAARAALHARIAASVGHAAVGKAAAATLFGAAGKTLAVIAVAAGIGAGVVAVTRHEDRPAAVVAPRAPSPAPEPPAAAPPAAVAPVPLPEAQQPAPVKPRPVPTAKSPSQVALIKQAWAAVNDGDAARALALARDDEQLHPDGVLGEERDALVVIALAKLERFDEARTAATRFIANHPASVHRALVERAIEPEHNP